MNKTINCPLCNTPFYYLYTKDYYQQECDCNITTNNTTMNLNELMHKWKNTLDEMEMESVFINNNEQGTILLEKKKILSQILQEIQIVCDSENPRCEDCGNEMKVKYVCTTKGCLNYTPH